MMPEAYDELLGLPFALAGSMQENTAPQISSGDTERRVGPALGAGPKDDPTTARRQLHAGLGRSYVYVPSQVNRSQPTPVLVFFHGSGGLFKAYIWILSHVADRLGFVVVAPSYGLGNWQAGASKASLDAALAAASRVATIDRSRIHLAGLSNGGLAVSQLAGLEGSQFRSMIFLSPVFDAGEIRGPSFAAQCRDLPVLVLTGGLDDRVPLRWVEANVEDMAQAGARVHLESIPDADHFLFFSHRKQVVDVMESWLRAHRGAP
jgi:pimeloyl-ACP methyl ester carboxylesterase